MMKISQISRKGAKQRKEIEKISAILCASAREKSLIHKKFPYIHCEEVFSTDASVSNDESGFRIE